MRRFGQDGDDPDRIRRAYDQALVWRDEWRAEITAGKVQPTKKPSPQRTDGDTMRRQAGFAQAVARAEFGRFYWDKRLQPGPERKKKTVKGRK
jgi:hypothetical protein